MTSKLNPRYLALFHLVLLTFSFSAQSTWSIIAVDHQTGAIGIAGASCTFDVQGIAYIVPEKGAIVVQAASNYYAKMKGVELMEHNEAPLSVLKAIRVKEFDPQRQQIGIISVDATYKPVAYSGEQIKDWSGSKTGDNVAVLGNILVGEAVIEQAFKQFNANKQKPLNHRIMAALSAGEQAGGDSRCGEQYARSAFVSYYDPNEEAIIKLSTYGLKNGGQPAVSLLRQQFEQTFKTKD